MANAFDEIKKALSNIKAEDFKWADDPGIATQEIEEAALDTTALNPSLWNSNTFTISSGGTGAAGQYLYNGMNGTAWSTTPSIIT